ncbi:hypothetical protein B0J12DRAFT_694471 [Macrophomina phaseolina]|uniref:Uncharacterized protein n=1 Tax=Macrophomina phaseolina TaxID=35725 RepID=A0ABQ8GSU1_9PEZI|nr:hypothetical protein B0J12DRAFT_694471 [Macrophomina phaseolina]
MKERRAIPQELCQSAHGARKGGPPGCQAAGREPKVSAVQRDGPAGEAQRRSFQGPGELQSHRPQISSCAMYAFVLKPCTESVMTPHRTSDPSQRVLATATSGSSSSSRHGQSEWNWNVGEQEAGIYMAETPVSQRTDAPKTQLSPPQQLRALQQHISRASPERCRPDQPQWYHAEDGSQGWSGGGAEGVGGLPSCTRATAS